ncbi:serine/threonine-protein phosphatase [Methylomonas sp. SURF-2]|uniref:Serine/threonine-protein phosphatase n=1 Tax=Methylomonas subterranea TaxID=2952225 RepID=A0ABT1TFJ1_9GAMM|nr:PP2C family serine/threonine-protein phosphatase [Methylomonas sp. SURF-2]MCQ8104233.1 serine/threonine-protein phosphatase [Methylomonas sp. SURF-2]
MQNALEFYQLSSVGDREINQDCMAHRVCADYALFVVADGLGGHQAGEKASRFFCRGLIEKAQSFQANIQLQPERGMRDWIAAAVERMRELFGDDPFAANAHTTCAILYLEPGRVITAHCGDSRIYRLNPERVVWRTKDHSLIQQLFDEGAISEWEMGVHPEQNKLTRSVNVLAAPVVDIQLFPAMQSGETFILCSDGFWESIKEQEFLRLSQPASGKGELTKMAQMAILRAHGKSDNCTVQWVRKR